VAGPRAQRESSRRRRGSSPDLAEGAARRRAGSGFTTSEMPFAKPSRSIRAAPEIKILGLFPIANRKRYSMLRASALDPVVLLSPRAVTIHPRQAREVWLRFRGLAFARWDDDRSSSRLHLASPLSSLPLFAIFSCLRNVLFWIPPAQ
jgi:hypothetical protein